MFKAIKAMKDGGTTITTHVSFIEIYQESVRDLGKAVAHLQQKGCLLLQVTCDGP